MRCTAKTREGKRCKRRGIGKTCTAHGGPTVADVAKNFEARGVRHGVRVAQYESAPVILLHPKDYEFYKTEIEAIEKQARERWRKDKWFEMFPGAKI